MTNDNQLNDYPQPMQAYALGDDLSDPQIGLYRVDDEDDDDDEEIDC